MQAATRVVTLIVALGFGVGLAFAPSDARAQGASKSEPAPKASKGEKVCRYKFPSGERRAWVCKKEEPCCAWDAIKYVKCGSTITGCL